MIEKRKNERIDKRILIRYLSENESATLFNATVTKNISNGGFCIKTNYNLKKGSKILVRFLLPNSSNYQETEAVVKWNKPIHKNYQYETGIQFINLNAEVVEAFQY